ncbi:MAG: NDP-hexose 4-ketoreductase, partial [Anaerolineales bacterium]|nr:AAA family ATPase [Anaerolineales bacterium]MDW8446576.1 NDP-hexose 4-ketoreductase [Anaerolineales bacterium]
VRKSGSLGFLQRTDSSEERLAQEKIEKALKSTFRPEFLNRIDEIIMFSPLSLEHMREIVDLQMKEVQERLSEHGITVELSEAARNWLAEVGYDPTFGARPLKRAIQKHLESPLSLRLLAGEFKEGDHLWVDVDPNTSQLIFQRKEQATLPLAKESALTV